MESALSIISSLLSASIIVASDTLSEIVGLYEAFVLAEIVSGPFEIKLVLIVAHEDATGDQTRARGSLNLNIDTTEHEVVLSPNVRSIVSFDERKVSTRGLTETDLSIIC